MDQQQKDQPFFWRETAMPQVYPIDYSIHELAKELSKPSEDQGASSKESLPRLDHKIKEHLVCNPLLKDTLEQCTLGDIQTEFKKYPLPLEAIVFLKCFFSMRTDDQYKSLFRVYNKREKPNVDLAQFTADFCKQLYTQLIPSKSGDDKLAVQYCRRILFQNPVFTKHVQSALWDEQVLPRMKLLQHLAEKTGAAMKIDALSSCLLALDQCVALFSNSSEGAEPTPSSGEQEICHMLQKLLSSREDAIKMGKKFPSQNAGAPSQDNGTPPQDDRGEDSQAQNNSLEERHYGLPNAAFTYSSGPSASDIKATDMEHAFERLKSTAHQPPNLMDAARSCYLEQLLTSTYPSDFELKYMQLYKYFSSMEDPKSIETIEANLSSYFLDWGITIIHACTTSSIILDIPPMDFSGWGYLGALANHLAQATMQDVLHIFDATLYMIRAFHLVSLFAWEQSCIDNARREKLQGVIGPLSTQVQLILDQFPQSGQEPLNASQSLSDQINDIFKAQLRWFGQTDCTLSLSAQLLHSFSQYFQRAWSFFHSEGPEAFDSDGKLADLSNISAQFVEKSMGAASLFGLKDICGYSPEYVLTKFSDYNQDLSGDAKSISLSSFFDYCIPILYGVLLQLLQRIKVDLTSRMISELSFISENLSTTID